MKAIVSLNGIDGTGKTQQIKILGNDYPDYFHIPKALVEYSSRWPKIRNEISFSKWWFEEISIYDLFDIFVESLNNRNLDNSTDKIVLLDRGCNMFKAVCVATWITRDDQISLEYASGIVNEKFQKGLRFDPKEEIQIILKPCQEYRKKIEPLLNVWDPPQVFTEFTQNRYERYQKNLRNTMAIFFPNSEFLEIYVDASICEIQNRIRHFLNKRTGLNLTEFANSISLMVGFGGLSESGKSSFAEHLRKSYVFSRLKLRYFIEILEKRGELRTNEKIVFELLYFLKCHYFQERISLESLHDPFIPAFLKLLLGEKFKTIFIEVAEEERIRREAQALKVNLGIAKDDIRKRDVIKQNRGALRVKDIADFVVNNNGDNLEVNLSKFTSMLGL